MFGHSSVHFQLNWVKERIDEMDASLASLERSAKTAKSRSGSDAKQLLAALRKRRDRFEAIVRKQARVNDTAWGRRKAQLETEWKKFEAQAAHQLQTTARQIEQKVAFRRASSVQATALQGAVRKLQDLADSIVPARRTGFQAVLRQLKAEGARAEARMRKLGRANAPSWPAMHAALAKSRDAFDRANQKAGDAIRHAIKG